MRKIIEKDRVYIDDTNIIYKVASVQYVGKRLIAISVYYVDPITKEEKIISVNPNSVRLFQVFYMS